MRRQILSRRCLFLLASSILGLASWNRAQQQRGLQIGLYNSSDRLRGVQIGLLNRAKSGGLLPWMPLFNVGWRR